MRFLITLLFLFFLNNNAICQRQFFYETVKEYFRVDPFSGTFSGFVRALTSDSALHQKEVRKQTETKGFEVYGEYENFNPYSIKANKVKMMFYELSEKIDNDNTLKYFSYQLTAFFPDNVATRRIIINEYKKLSRKLKRELFNTQKKSLKNFESRNKIGEKVIIEDGEITTFKNDDYFTEPAIISWQTLGESSQLGLTIIIKLKQEDNVVVPFGLY